MGSTKAQFKYALRCVRKNKEMIKVDALASDLLNNDYKSYCKDVRKLNSCVSIQSNVIDGVSGEFNITNLWKTYFCNILNANSIDGDLKK